MTTESLLTGQASTEAGTQPAAEPTAAPAAAPAGGNPQGQQPAVEAKTEPAAAPEKYDFAVPDGFELNQEVAGEFETYARELNLPQDKAQAVVMRIESALSGFGPSASRLQAVLAQVSRSQRR